MADNENWVGSLDAVRTLEADVCAIGGGSGGRTVAANAVAMGARTVLIEKTRMGGECLWTGCVPSKALLAAGRVAETVRQAADFGIEVEPLRVNDGGVYAHVRRTIAAIEPHDSAEHFEGMGVRVVIGTPRFTGPNELEVGGKRIRAHRIVIATGSSPAVPAVPGIDEVAYLTNKTLFDRKALPDHLIVLGAGATGVEMAQAHRRLGCRVTLLEVLSMLSREDPGLVAVLRDHLVREGVDVREGIQVRRVERARNGVRVVVNGNGGEELVDGSHLLVATGRRANVDGLDLDVAGVTHSDRGILVDSQMRTTNRRIYAIGDVAAGFPQFSHMAVHHAQVALANMLFRLPLRVRTSAVPQVVYTEPELAKVGVTEAEAHAARTRIRVVRWAYTRNDRAEAERQTEGLIKVIATPWGRVLGVGIVGAEAGEVIQKWTLAVGRRMNLRTLTWAIAPYPTMGYSDRKVSGTFFESLMRSRIVRTVVRTLAQVR